MASLSGRRRGRPGGSPDAVSYTHLRAHGPLQPKEMSDAALVVAVAARNQAALAELYQRHSASVYGLARRLLGTGPGAEDVTQEIFVRLWSQPERFDAERGSLRSYLLAQTHSRSIDIIRSTNARRNREERDARLTETDQVLDPVEEAGTRIEDRERVRSVLAALPENERKAIELAYFGGRTYQEVAQALDIPEGTIKSRIRTGLRRMKAELQET